MMNTTTTPQNFINSKQLAELLNMPVFTIRKLVREKVIPAYKITGKNFLFNYDEVIEVIKNHKV